MTSLVCTSVDVQKLFVLAVAAIGVTVVAKRGATSGNRRRQRVLNCLGQSLVAKQRYFACWTQGVNTRTKQTLTRIDVAHAHDDLRVHDKSFDRLLAGTTHVKKMLT